jgi:hypothetical protein
LIKCKICWKETFYVYNCLFLIIVGLVEWRIRVKKCIIVGANMQASPSLYAASFEVNTALCEKSDHAHYPYCSQLSRAFDLHFQAW